VCSVRGLYRAFPPSDPPVYVRPQLKPSHGIYSFTTMTFGAHRGADQGAGRSTSGRDLHRLLGGSTSASPPSATGILQLPGLTSTRSGRHTAVLDLHQHLRAGTQFHPTGIFYVPSGIFMSRPAYMGLGSTSAFPGPAYDYSGRNILYPSRNFRSQAGMQQIWPLLAGIAGFRADPGQFRSGRCSKIPAGPTVEKSRLGRRASSPAGPDLPSPGWARSPSSGWAGLCFLPAGPTQPPRCSRPGLGCRPASRPAPAYLVGRPSSGWASASASRRIKPARPLGQAPVGRPDLSPGPRQCRTRPVLLYEDAIQA
jgi:hypothetical protein